MRTGGGRPYDFGSPFTSSYDPGQDNSRGPIFEKSNKFGAPRFLPRDLKKHVDQYVIGQDRAKKVISSAVFNHYQRLKRIYIHELEDKKLREKHQRQQFGRERDRRDRQTSPHPVEGKHSLPQTNPRHKAKNLNEGEYPGHADSVADIPISSVSLLEEVPIPVPVSTRIKIDKSNLLLMGPTGVGKTYILK
jgi:ATP-dependent Clp protease ATP-binding subunit ClpX